MNLLRNGVALLTAMLWCAGAAHAADRASGERALLEGRVDEAITLLNAVVAASPADGAAHLLLCRAYYSEDVIDPAVKECEAAIANGGAARSETQDWMGRVYGAKAGRVNFMSAYGLAKRVKAAFEAAVQLDPGNVAAVNDLAEYYVNAPGAVGGGTDKALALAKRVEDKLPQCAHRTRALVAVKNKDAGTAEREFKAAAEASGRPDAWIDLAAFYQQHKQPAQAIAALRKVQELDKAKDASLSDVASILFDLHQETPLAVAAARSYLASPNRSDAAPAVRVRVLLGHLLESSGDKAGAQREFKAALALAANYAPARKALEAQR